MFVMVVNFGDWSSGFVILCQFSYLDLCVCAMRSTNRMELLKLYMNNYGVLMNMLVCRWHPKCVNVHEYQVCVCMCEGVYAYVHSYVWCCAAWCGCGMVRCGAVQCHGRHAFVRACARVCVRMPGRLCLCVRAPVCLGL